MAQARVALNRKTLDLAVVGPRKEDIAEAEARLQGNEAQVAFLKQQLIDTALKAPIESIVRSRLLEAGEMSSPQRPVFSLAPVEKKWVRAYVSEPDLGKIREGLPAEIDVDSFPGKPFSGWIGFISPVAEFTPKTVQTDELRTKLVYEVRVWVKDADNRLRLGMPATVRLNLAEPSTTAPSTPVTSEQFSDGQRP
jgi:HlyD family secretion protein